MNRSFNLYSLLHCFGISLLTFTIVSAAGCGRNVNSIDDSHFEPDGFPRDSIAFFSPKHPESVKLYVETSGSMNGFFRANKATNFKKTVWSVFSGLEPLTNGTVAPMSNGGDLENAVSLDEFRKKMNAGSFVSNSSTHIPDMLKNIIQNIDTAKNEVAVLVSDMKYSPMGKMAEAEVGQYQEQIRNVVFNNSGYSVSFVCAGSEYLNTNGSVAEPKSPYYYIIIGPSESVAYMRDSISRWCEATGSYIESGDMGMDYHTPEYTINDVNNGILSVDCPKTLITACSTEVSDTCSFILRIDMTGYPWGAVKPEVLEKCLTVNTTYGASADVKLLTEEDHLVDDHAYKDEFKRMSYADYLIKVFNFPMDDEVVEWTFSNKPFDGLCSGEFNKIITATDESDLSGSYSFDKFIKGVYNAKQNNFDEEPVRILISSAQ